MDFSKQFAPRPATVTAEARDIRIAAAMLVDAVLSQQLGGDYTPDQIERCRKIAYAMRDAADDADGVPAYERPTE